VLLILFGLGGFILLRLRRKARLQKAKIGLRGAEDGAAHEMDRFILRGSNSREEEEEDAYSDETYRQSTSNLANGSISRRNESAQRDVSEEIFDVGNESD
jgi:hypothetical protein